MPSPSELATSRLRPPLWRPATPTGYGQSRRQQLLDRIGARELVAHDLKPHLTSLSRDLGHGRQLALQLIQKGCELGDLPGFVSPLECQLQLRTPRLLLPALKRRGRRCVARRRKASRTGVRLQEPKPILGCDSREVRPIVGPQRSSGRHRTTCWTPLSLPLMNRQARFWKALRVIRFNAGDRIIAPLFEVDPSCPAQAVCASLNSSPKEQ